MFQRLLSLTGALVVFATFIVKDNLRESARTENARWNAAIVNFATRADSLAIRNKLETMTVQGSKLPKVVNEATDIENFLTFSQSFLATTKDRLGILADYEDGMFSSPHKDQRLVDLQMHMGRIEEFVEGLSKSRSDGKNTNPLYRDWQGFLHGDTPHNLRALVFGDLAVLSSRVEDLQQALKDGAKGAAKRSAAELARYDSISTWLYVLGWGLALGGKLAES